MNEPNLFDYATSELSQDAFLAWFFKWAEKKYSKIDKGLQKCAEKALKNLIAQANPKYTITGDINSVEVMKQEEHIDLCLVVNEKLNVIIEDKVETRAHGTQLLDYKEIYRYKKACFAYIKVGKINQKEEEKVRESGYTIFDKNWLEQHLNAETSNPIFTGYKDKIKTRVTVNYLLDNVKNPFRNKLCCWATNCVYIWLKKDFPLKNKKYLALDIWVNCSENTVALDFYIHVKDKNNKWYVSKEIEEIFRDELTDLYKYLKDNNFTCNDSSYSFCIIKENQEDAKKYIEEFLEELYKIKN